MKSPFTHQDVPSNVHGWERAASIAGGLVLLGKGLSRGGIGGVLAMALGGAALTRGMTGRCEAKRIFNEFKDNAAEQGVTRPMGNSQSQSAVTGADPLGPLGGNTATAATADTVPDTAPLHPEPDVNPNRKPGGNYVG